MSRLKFLLGTIVATPGAMAALTRAGQDPAHFLRLHQSGAWGDLGPEDRRANDEAVAHEDDPERQQRVLSSYLTIMNERIWVITEHDRSVTTLLLPEEY